MATPAPEPFVMHGARAAMAAGLTHIGEQIEGIEQAVVDNPGLTFDLAKVLIETICKVVLDELSVHYTKDDDLPTLFKYAKQRLSFLPATASTASTVRKSLDKTLNGLSTAVQGVCELRNQCGFASHGSGAPRPAMEGIQALLAAETADAIVGFLYVCIGRIRPRRPQRLHPSMKTPPLTKVWMRPSGLFKSMRSCFARARYCSLWSQKPTASTWQSLMAIPKLKPPPTDRLCHE